MATSPINDFIDEHLDSCESDELRFGQRFVVKYYAGRWDSLYYERNDVISTQLIIEWLKRMGYTESLPQTREHV